MGVPHVVVLKFDHPLPLGGFPPWVYNPGRGSPPNTRRLPLTFLRLGGDGVRNHPKKKSKTWNLGGGGGVDTGMERRETVVKQFAAESLTSEFGKFSSVEWVLEGPGRLPVPETLNQVIEKMEGEGYTMTQLVVVEPGLRLMAVFQREMWW